MSFFTYVALITNDGEPSCYQEAMKVSESAKRKLTMKEEMDSLEKNKTWDLVELPKGCWLQVGLHAKERKRLQNTKKYLYKKSTLIRKVLISKKIFTSH